MSLFYAMEPPGPHSCPRHSGTWLRPRSTRGEFLGKLIPGLKLRLLLAPGFRRFTAALRYLAARHCLASCRGNL